MIEVSHLSKFFGTRAAVNDLTFEVQSGEIVGFLGPNGAGKSTTMKILTAFMPASAGTAKICGYDVFDHPMEVKKNIGFLPENPPVYPEMSIQDYIDFAARLHQVPRSKIAQAVAHVIEKTGLGDVRRRLIGNLSKGYRQRVGLAQALVHNPKVLILDEPTVGLDPQQIIAIRELIKSLKTDHTVILSSHILPEVTATCERIIVINRGKIVAEDTIDHLSARMKKGLIYSMELKSPHVEGVNAIRQLKGLGSITQTGSKLTIEIKAGNEEVRDLIVEAAVNHKMGVLDFSAEKMSLEEIFLELTTVEKAS